MQTRVLLTCPGCGATDARPAAIAGLRRCTSCRLVRTTELVDPGDLYVDGYMTGASGSGFGPPDVLDPHFADYLRFAAEARLDRIERHAEGRGRLLDVGCGTGENLLAAQQRGWDGVGIDLVPGSVAIACSRGLDARCVDLADADLPDSSFEVVTAFHVLEHVTDAAAFLRGLTRLVRPGGLVHIEVPNWSSSARRAYGEHWVMLQPLEHVAHYRRSTLRAALRRAGLEPLELTSTGFLWSEQTLDEALTDLGIRRGRQVFARLGQPAQRRGTDLTIPSPRGWVLLNALQAVAGRMGHGAVLTATARVPPCAS